MNIREYARELEKMTARIPDIVARAQDDTDLTWEQWMLVDAALIRIQDAIYALRDRIQPE